MDKDKPVSQDIPDIVIEFSNAKTLILDAKNSILDEGEVYPYRRQMDSYLRSAGIDNTNFGIFIFSSAAKENWKEIEKEEQKIMWIGLSPRTDTNTKIVNEQAIEKITHIIKQCGAK